MGGTMTVAAAVSVGLMPVCDRDASDNAARSAQLRAAVVAACRAAEPLSHARPTDTPDRSARRLRLVRLVDYLGRAEQHFRQHPLADADLWFNVFHLAGDLTTAAEELSTSPGRCVYWWYHRAKMGEAVYARYRHQAAVTPDSRFRPAQRYQWRGQIDLVRSLWVWALARDLARLTDRLDLTP